MYSSEAHTVKIFILDYVYSESMEVLVIRDGWVLRIGSVVSMARQIFVVDKLKYEMGYEMVMNE